MITRNLQMLGVLLFAALALSTVTAASAFANPDWLVDGELISEAEGTLATETEGLLELIVLESNAVRDAVDCEEILDGSVGFEGRDEITEVLSLSTEKVTTLGAMGALSLACEVVKTGGGLVDCILHELAQVSPDNLPWVTQLESMEGEGQPAFLDVVGSSGKEWGWEIVCKSPIGNLEVLCEGLTSAKVENTTENDVLETFNPEAPIESQSASCSVASISGDIAGEGLILLTSGKALSTLKCEQVLFGTGTYANESDCLMNPGLNPGSYNLGWDDLINP
jgi:hypothetical protein